MNQSDQIRASRLLRVREEGIKFRWNYLLRSKRLMGLAIIAVCILIYSIFNPSSDLLIERSIWLVGGVFIGRILRDLAWLKDSVDAFPFLKKVLNWDKIETIAKK